MPGRSSAGFRPASGLAALFALLAPATAHGQQGPIRSEVERIATEVAVAEDPRGLVSLANRLRQAAEPDSSREALRRLHLGFVRLRLHQLGLEAPSAAADFERATELRPEWARAWYGRGLAKRAEGDRLAQNRLELGTRVGFGRYEEAVRHFERALALEPDFAPALRELAATIALLKDTARVRGVLIPALARAPAASSDSLVLLARIGAERSLGDPLAALEGARRLLAITGPSARAYRELAWSGFLAGNLRAREHYFEGARHDDSLGVALYREDLAFIADSAALAAFDRASGEGRAAFLREFWLDRDRAAVRPEGSRLVEHYRRIAEAERRFGLEVNRRYHHAWDSYRSGSTRFDDRGIVYIRHGEPDDTISSVTYGLPPNLTWRYRHPDGDLLLHFAANHGTIEYGPGGDLHDYRLIPSLWAVIRPDGQSGQNALDALLESRCPVYQPYCKYSGWGRFGRTRIVRDEQDVVGTSVAVAVASDGHELRFPRELAGDAALFAVGQVDGHPLVHAAWQLLMLRPPGADSASFMRTTVQVRFALFDSTGKSVGWVDTTVALAARARSDTVIVPGRVAVAVPPGSWRYRLAVISDDSVGRVFPTDSVSPKAADGTRLVVSDLVLGRRDVSVPWAAAPGDTAFFTPGARWRQGDELEVYHEVYGLRAGEEYRARLIVRRGRRAVLTLGWEGRGDPGVTRVARSLDLASLRPGEYRIEVEVTNADGTTARSGRRLVVRDRE